MTCNADPARTAAGRRAVHGRARVLPHRRRAAGGRVGRCRRGGAAGGGAAPWPLPFFGEDDGLLPGRAGRGSILGPPPQDAAERRALALIATALLTDLLLDALGRTGRVVLDGSFTNDPLYPALVAALRPGADVAFNRHSDGVAAGAALLAGHTARTAPAKLALDRPARLDIPGLADYRARWRGLIASDTRNT